MVSEEEAQRATLEALGWIASDEARIGAFLAATGAAPETLRESAREPGFMASVWDYIMLSDETVLEFCEASGRAPESIAQIRAALPGGDTPHWT